jgi:hypothetical protein
MPQAPNLGLTGAGGAQAFQNELQQMIAERRAQEVLAFNQALAQRKAAVEEQNARTNEFEAVARMTATGSPSVVRDLRSTDPTKTGPYAVGIDRTGRRIWEEAQSPDAQSSGSSAEFERFMRDHVIPERARQWQAQGNAGAPPPFTSDEVIAWKDKYQKAGDAELRPFMQRPVQSGSEYLIWDPNTQTFRQPTGPGGDPMRLPLPATSEQRNVLAAGRRAQPVLQGISELADRINTGSGLMAKAVGEVEKLKAQANYNDDVAEYTSLIKMFTPSIARAVGHVGVLTEPDVQSVRQMFPQPGDSKTLKDRKIARIASLLDSISMAGADEPAVGTRPGTTPPVVARPGGGRTGPENEQQALDKLVPYTSSFVPVQKDNVWWGKTPQGEWVQVSPDGKYIIGR